MRITCNSEICNFINEHPNWRDLLIEEYRINIKEEYPFAIFNYGIDCDFSNPIVQEARGIIIDIEDYKVVCWPFRKFGNYNESYADEIDWNTARVQDKVDGSIIKLWRNEYSEKWQFSTNSTINADNALANQMTQESFLDVIRRADNYNDILLRLPILNKNFTFMFELVSPETQVVVKYPTAHLYHIGTRNNITGIENAVNIGIERPQEYPLRSLGDCINASIQLNQSGDGQVHNVKKEGFVVVDGNWNRIKVKSPDYLMLHRMSSNSNFSKERIIDLLRSGSVNVYDISEDFPNFSHYFKYYDFKMAELSYQAKVFCDLTDRVYEEYSHERKAVANIIKNHRLAAIGFMHLDSGKSGAEILETLPLRKYCRYIPDYQPERLSELFYQRGD